MSGFCARYTTTKTRHIPLHSAPAVTGSVFIRRFRLLLAQCDVGGNCVQLVLFTSNVFCYVFHGEDGLVLYVVL